jgi:histidine ammonia-lyase
MSDSNEIHCKPLNWNSICKALESRQKLVLDPEAIGKIRACRTYLDERMQNEHSAIYGINTGFGALCNTVIAPEQLTQLQKNLVFSHACGRGNYLPDSTVKTMLWLKIRNLCFGNSGVSEELVNRLLLFYNEEIWPLIPEAGSLGASGDLAPLAHLTLPVLGHGKVSWKGQHLDAAHIHQKLGIQPLELKSKEGLAMLNGTQFMSAVLLESMRGAEHAWNWAMIISALSLEAYLGLHAAFDQRIAGLRPHEGHALAALRMRQLLDGSELQTLPRDWVQDPYSFRCIPQVHGASWDALQFVTRTLVNEINSVTDNPLIFPEDDLIISGGNFHGQPLALAADFAAIALSELGSISERRIYKLLDGQRGLPVFLTPNPGLNSGFMIVQYAAASLVNRNKQRCMPHSVDTIDSSRGQEDHVSMGANAAVKCAAVVQDVERILAMELFTASQALSFRKNQKTGKLLQPLLQAFREKVPFIEADSNMQPFLDASENFLKSRNTYIEWEK